jgi:hypothetical protein
LEDNFRKKNHLKKAKIPLNLRLFIYTFIDRIDVIKKIFALSKKELKAISGYLKDYQRESD